MTNEELTHLINAAASARPAITQTLNFNAPIGQQIAHVDCIEAHFDKDMGMNVVQADDTAAPLPRTHERTDPAAPSTVLTPPRREALGRLLRWMDRAPWTAPASPAGVRHFLLTVLGAEGGSPLTGSDPRLSARLWRLMEHGRGDRLEITAMNLTGYFVGRRMLPSGSPALAKAIFGTGSQEKYCNINKGNPDCQSLSQGFGEVLPLLDKYLPLARSL